MKGVNKLTLLAACAILSCVTRAANITGPQYGPTNDTWNYDQGGSDWNYNDCTYAQYVQAPVNLTNINTTVTETFTGYVTYLWSENGYAFLPDIIKGFASWYGVEQYVY